MADIVTSGASNTRVRDLLLIAVAILIGVGFWVRFQAKTHLTLEDALITYRFAENLAAGHGFVYNEGERVFGTTTPLLTLLLTAGCAIGNGVATDVLSKTLMGLAGCVTIAAIYLTLRRVQFPPAAAFVPALIFAIHPDTAWFVTGGMETALVVCLMAVSLWSLAAERWRTAMVLAALLVLTRIDGALWAILVTAVVLIRGRRRVITPLVLGAAIVAAWSIFAWRYFGNPLPNSLLAKRALAMCPATADAPLLASLFDRSAWHLGALWLSGGSGFAFIQVGLWLAACLLGVLAVMRRREARVLVLLPIFIVLFCGAFFVGRAPQFNWYLAPVTWASIMLGSMGLAEAWVMLRLYRREFRISHVAIYGAAAVALLFLAAGLVKRGETSLEYWREVQQNEDACRRVVGEWLRENTAADATVAMEAIGYQGYYSDRSIVDLAGLVTPRVVAIMRDSASNAETFHRTLQELRPDYVVLRTFEVERNQHFYGGALFETEEQRRFFEDAYEPVRTFTAPHRGPWSGEPDLTLHHRRGCPAPGDENAPRRTGAAQGVDAPLSGS